MRRTLYDQHGGILRYIEQLPCGMLHGVTVQEVGGILDANARDADVDQRKRTFRLAARMPLSEIDKLLRDGSFKDSAYMKRFLNNSDNKRMRVWQGRL